MQQGALFSAVLHLAILALVLIGLPTSSNPFEVGSPVAVPIVFENAPIAETTNQVEGGQEQEQAKPEPPTPPEKPEPKPEQQAALEPPPEPEPTPVQPPPEPEAVVTPPPPAPTPTPPQPEPEPQVAEPEPPPPEPQPVEEQVAVAAPQPEPAPEPVPVPTPETPVDEVAKQPDPAAPPEKPKKKVTVPEPPKEEPKKKEDPLDSILKDVTKREEPPQEQSQPQEQQEPATDKPQTESGGKKTGGAVSQSIKDAVAGQVGKCWWVDGGAMEQVAVEIRAYMNPDGTVQSAEIVDAGRYTSDARLRRHAESALRAVKNPNCQPFTQLPANAYDEWSVIVFNLDPQSMF